MRTITSKKAQVQTLAPAIIALIVAAFFLVFGLIINQSLRDTDVINQAVSSSVTDEVEDRVINETSINVNTVATSTTGANSYTLDAVFNSTDDVTANFTMDSAGGLVYSGGAGSAANVNNTADWSMNYSYKEGGDAYLNTNKTLVGLATFADFWEIIILAIVISIVIGLLLIVFAGRRTR